MLRTIILFLYIVIYLLLGVLLFPVIGILKLFKNEKAAGTLAFHYIRFACRSGVFLAGAHVDAAGLENVKRDGAALYILNHRSIFDIIITYSYMVDRTGFIAKKELRRVPLFAQWILFGNGLFLDRNDLRQGMQTILKGISYLKSGVNICIFPEGTRNKDKESKTSLLEFHSGSFKLAEKSGVPIIPVALYNTSACFEDHLPKIRSSDVKITFGEPIVISDLPKEKKRFLSEHVRDVLKEMLEKYEEA